jgi:hypothetical protein
MIVVHDETRDVHQHTRRFNSGEPECTHDTHYLASVHTLLIWNILADALIRLAVQIRWDLKWSTESCGCFQENWIMSWRIGTCTQGSDAVWRCR